VADAALLAASGIAMYATQSRGAVSVDAISAKENAACDSLSVGGRGLGEVRSFSSSSSSDPESLASCRPSIRVNSCQLVSSQNPKSQIPGPVAQSTDSNFTDSTLTTGSRSETPIETKNVVAADACPVAAVFIRSRLHGVRRLKSFRALKSQNMEFMELAIIKSPSPYFSKKAFP
jgi:uncharacterized protein (UPF0333 family)